MTLHGRTRMANFAGKSGRFRRSMVGLMVSYVFAIQSVFAGLSGLVPASNADPSWRVFELCLHGAQGAPVSPIRLPGDICGDHCILCVSQHLLSPPPSKFERLDVEVGSVNLPMDNRCPFSINGYLIASPRGPPLEACARRSNRHAIPF
jgi:hypothetical protein